MKQECKSLGVEKYLLYMFTSEVISNPYVDHQRGLNFTERVISSAKLEVLSLTIKTT